MTTHTDVDSTNSGHEILWYRTVLHNVNVGDGDIRYVHRARSKKRLIIIHVHVHVAGINTCGIDEDPRIKKRCLHSY